MTIAITAEQRDALYELILVNLSGIEDVWIAASQEDYDTAARLGRAYSDDLRLILDDLGWGEGEGEAVELRSDPEVLRRIFTRLLDTRAGQREAEQARRAEAREAERQLRLVDEACARVLSRLDEQSRESG